MALQVMSRLIEVLPMIAKQRHLSISEGGLWFGLIGGFVGTVLMDLVMVMTFVAVGMSPDTFFSMVGEKLGGGAALGLMVHNAIGLSAGFAYAVLILHWGSDRFSGLRIGFRTGLAAGVITIFLGCIPMAIWLGQSIPGVLAFATLPHLVWGSVVGVVMGYWAGLSSAGSQRMRNNSVLEAEST